MFDRRRRHSLPEGTANVLVLNFGSESFATGPNEYLGVGVRQNFDFGDRFYMESVRAGLIDRVPQASNAWTGCRKLPMPGLQIIC